MTGIIIRKMTTWVHFGIQLGLLFLVVLFCGVTPGYSNEDLLKATQNPVADLISVPIQNITNFNIGPYNRTENIVSLQPVIPMALSEDWLLVTRIIMPITLQPYLDQKTGEQLGPGDMSPTFFLAPRKPGNLIWGVGPAMVIPTATHDVMGQDKFGIGPSAVVLAQPGNWTVGALASNVWSVAGSDSSPSVNRMSLQYFISYNLKDDWYLSSAPTLVADWTATGEDRWLVPFGGGIGKLITIGSTPVDISVSFYSNVIRPSSGPSWQTNLQVTLLFPKS